LLLAVVAPIAFGAVCGILLGLSEGAYVVATLVAGVGGLGAGFEHDRPREGALRGVFGGILFGLAIVIVDGISSADAKADLPDPPVLLAIVTAAFGAGLGALGALIRSRRVSSTPAEPR
jgi:hypothetical protein